MAGDWIPIQKSTPKKKKTLQIASSLKWDRRTVVGHLVDLWIWVDDNSVDGHVDGSAPQLVDALVDALATPRDFFDALFAANWIVDSGHGLYFPNTEEWLENSAKSRMLKTLRQKRWRKKQGNDGLRVDAQPSTPTSTSTSTPASTREEKRRDDDGDDDVFNTPPSSSPPSTQGGAGGNGGCVKFLTETAKLTMHAKLSRAAVKVSEVRAKEIWKEVVNGKCRDRRAVMASRIMAEAECAA